MRGGFDNIGSALSSVVDVITNLPQLIIDGIGNLLKSIFLPSDGFIEEKLDFLKRKFEVTFGIGAYDISHVFSEEKALTDVKISFYGKNLTLVKMKYVLNALATFRPVIRGFIALLLVFYNINQFLAMVGCAPVTLGALFSLDKGDKQNDT